MATSQENLQHICSVKMYPTFQSFLENMSNNDYVNLACALGLRQPLSDSFKVSRKGRPVNCNSDVAPNLPGPIPFLSRINVHAPLHRAKAFVAAKVVGGCHPPEVQCSAERMACGSLFHLASFLLDILTIVFHTVISPGISVKRAVANGATFESQPCKKQWIGSIL